MSRQQEAALKINHLTKLYDSTHGIRDINLEVKQGEVFGFLGPNGAGKTTTINTLLDLLRPDKGTISILGLDHQADAKAAHARLGYVSGDMETDPTLTGKQYLRYAAHLRGNVDSAVVESLVKRLQADVTTKIKHLSRGNKQKIGLIAALMHDPDMLILDEPTSGLDPLMQAEFNAIIREQRKKGKTTFISSHVLSEVQSICDRVAFIRSGSLIKVSTLEALMQTAIHKVTVHFKHSPSKSAFAQLSGVKDLKSEDDTLSFTFDGDMNRLLALLAKHPVNNITIAEPDLEELFMNYYRSEGKSNV